jgi:hypothetical protein
MDKNELVIDMQAAGARYCDIYDIRGRRALRLKHAAGKPAYRISMLRSTAFLAVFRDAQGSVVYKSHVLMLH